MSLDYVLSFEHMRSLAEGIEDNTLQVLKEQDDRQVESDGLV